MYAREKGLGIVIMEPLRGGALVKNLSSDITNIINNSSTNRSAVGWAFKFLYDKKEIDVVLSGMSSLEQVVDNINIASKEGIKESMSKYEKETIKELRDMFKSKIRVNCTRCKYCIPCPNSVEIPNCFELLNNAYMFNDIEKNKEQYNMFLVDSGNDAKKCVECGLCEEKCPQHINIIEKLKEVKDTFK